MAQKTELPDIAKLNHFTEGNLYTGSKTKDWEKGTVIRYKEFALTAVCVYAVRNWLMERYLQL